MYTAENRIAVAIAACGNRAVQTNAILSPSNTFESRLDWSWIGENSQFDALVAELFQTNSGTMSRDLHARVARYSQKLGPKELVATVVETKQLAKSLAFLSTIGVEIGTGTKIVLAENLGKGVLGMAKDGTIYIAREAFAQGTARLAGTIFEEWAHVKYDFLDCSRGFQNWLIDKIISVGQEKNGEPL